MWEGRLKSRRLIKGGRGEVPLESLSTDNDMGGGTSPEEWVEEEGGDTVLSRVSYVETWVALGVPKVVGLMSVVTGGSSLWSVVTGVVIVVG